MPAALRDFLAGICAARPVPSQHSGVFGVVCDSCGRWFFWAGRTLRNGTATPAYNTRLPGCRRYALPTLAYLPLVTTRGGADVAASCDITLRLPFTTCDARHSGMLTAVCMYCSHQPTAAALWCTFLIPLRGNLYVMDDRRQLLVSLCVA